MTEFFTRNIIGVYFFYGLSFFSMGLAVLLEVGHSSELYFARSLRPLAAFGLLHGSHEWFEMFLLIHPGIIIGTGLWTISIARMILLSTSFFMLLAFGASLVFGRTSSSIKLTAILAVLSLWTIGLYWVIRDQPSETSRILAADVYTRYAVAIPGAALTAWGLILQRQSFEKAGMVSFGKDVVLAAIAFALYGGVGQLFASPSAIFPSNYLNADAFAQWFGFPIQVFRATMACMAAIFIIRSLRAFEVENKRRLVVLQETQAAERQRLEDLRNELFHRTVRAQEAERQRIARELHDETGQTLTALGMGLRGLVETANANPVKAAQQAIQLESLAMKGVEELQRLVGGLHPPQLDDLGLLAALRSYANEINRRFSLEVNILTAGPGPELPPDVRIVLFRIAQEAITNIVRHAQASRVTIRIDRCDASLKMQVEDNGSGFDVDHTLRRGLERPCLGLLGMMERATLVGGTCTIRSSPGQGTCVEVSVPWISGG
jgi:signal transduction histidine kinase